MTDGGVSNGFELGERIALARMARNLAQSDLAERVGLERTAISKIESGGRRVAALELARIGEAVDRPLAWFLSSSPSAIISRRAEQSIAPTTGELDAELRLEVLALEVGQLMKLGMLVPGPGHSLVGELGEVIDVESARRAAARAREICGGGDQPLGGMASVLEMFGLYAYSFELDAATDGLMLHLDDGGGVCVINGRAEPGRRRATAAHELGHFLFEDAYSAESLSATQQGENERLINAFASEFLLPLGALRAQWRQRGGAHDPRSAAVAIAREYRVSWSSLLLRLAQSDLISGSLRRQLAPEPTRAEFLARGRALPVPDLDPPDLAPAVSAAVMSAYEKDLINERRALEMLHGLADSLPAKAPISIHKLRGEFFSDGE
jgi:Zn-dependent peptidase ImmA (M78 family)/transcriptional regulator with XRE-family HTH domain